MFMKKSLAIVAAAVFSVAGIAHSAVIDSFSTTSSLIVTTIGVPLVADTASAGAIGGNRRSTLNITAGAGDARILTNSPNPGIATFNSASGVDANFLLSYGDLADLNAHFAVSSNAFLVRILRTDLGSLTNTITATTTGVGSFTVGFVVPGLVGNGGPAAPFDVIVPFSSFTGVDFTNVDKISYGFNLPQAADWQIQVFATTGVPEPTALGMLAPAGMFLARRRRA
jgi:hypothetical protein